jgi:hypothetical protein
MCCTVPKHSHAMFVDAPWYVSNRLIQGDLQTSTVNSEIRHYLLPYSARLSVHQNDLVVSLMAQPYGDRGVLRQMPNNLPTILYMYLFYF